MVMTKPTCIQQTFYNENKNTVIGFKIESHGCGSKAQIRTFCSHVDHCGTLVAPVMSVVWGFVITQFILVYYVFIFEPLDEKTISFGGSTSYNTNRSVQL